MPMEDYARTRKARRRSITALKKNRRVAVGPDATFYFECFGTIWHQVHEMLYIEGGGEDQIAGELKAYNPLVPKGRELVATLMFEIDDAVRRDRILGGLGGVEETVSLTVEEEVIEGVVGAVHPLPVHARPDRYVSPARLPRGARRRSPELPAHGGPARSRPRRALRGLRLILDSYCSTSEE